MRYWQEASFHDTAASSLLTDHGIFFFSQRDTEARGANEVSGKQSRGGDERQDGGTSVETHADEREGSVGIEQ